ncbi:ESYT1 protein, partial [Tyrannus savana]|nr:ESYT1 protein [Tyrannus savana]
PGGPGGHPGVLPPPADPPLQGVVRVHLQGARDLRSKDRFMGGLVEGKSDPYAVLRVGTQVFTSRVIDDNLNPTWDEVYEFIVHEVPGQEVEVELFDKDPDQDDLLGRCGGDGPPTWRWVLGGRADPPSPQWFPLQEGGQGRLHLRLEWLSLMSDASQLDQVLHTNSLLQPARGEELSAALLSVFLRKGSKAPSAFASLAVGNVSFKTKVRRGGGGPRGVLGDTGGVSHPFSSPQTCTPSAEPMWDEGFSFLIKRPHEESLQLQVKEEGGQPLGSLSLPLPQLLASEGLALDGWFPLAGGGPGTQILLRAQLGVLVSQQVEARAGGSLEGGDTDPQPTEACGEQEEEQCGTGGLRQRLPPADSPPEPAEGPRLQLTLWYHRDERKLVAIVHACRELRAAAKELPDPYVSLVLLPDRSRGTKRKTSVQRKTLNPDFNERFEWDLSLEEVSQRRLEAHVKSTLSFMTREKEALGKV